MGQRLAFLLRLLGAGLLLSPALSLASGPIQPGRYVADVSHTSIRFSVTHLGLATTTGVFKESTGVIEVSPSGVVGGRVKFEIQSKSLDTGFDRRDAELKSEHYFEVTRFPLITFSSQRVTKAGHKYKAWGDLTIKGVSKEISIPFRLSGPLRDSDGATRIGVNADPVIIKRSWFGIYGWLQAPDGSPGVSDEVTINLSLEAVLQPPAGSS